SSSPTSRFTTQTCSTSSGSGMACGRMRLSCCVRTSTNTRSICAPIAILRTIRTTPPRASPRWRVRSGPLSILRASTVPSIRSCPISRHPTPRRCAPCPKTFAKMCDVRGRPAGAAVCGGSRARPAASAERAQAFALQAHNIKTRWRESLGDKSGEEARKTALCAPGLKEALQWYIDAFSLDLNHVYPGLSALSLLCIRNALAQAMPDVWKDQFDSDADAARELSENLAQFEQLASAIQLSLKSRRESLQPRPAPESDDPVWLEVFEADIALLTSTRPKAVAQRYRDALT